MGKKIGLAGGFSARYGTVTRRQYVEIVTGLRGKHECPRCMFNTVKRWSVGVWHCRKCGYKFAGGAYTPRTKLGEIAARATRGLMSPRHCQPSSTASAQAPKSQLQWRPKSRRRGPEERR